VVQYVIEEGMKGQFRRWLAASNGQVRQDKFLESFKAQFRRNLPPARTFRHFRLPKKGSVSRIRRQGQNSAIPTSYRWTRLGRKPATSRKPIVALVDFLPWQANPQTLVNFQKSSLSDCPEGMTVMEAQTSHHP
jgi:hypothetical protein